MNVHVVLVTSNSADPVVEVFADRGSAVSRMLRILTDGGWPYDAAAAAAEKGDEVMTGDGGDDDAVRILDRPVRKA